MLEDDDAILHLGTNPEFCPYETLTQISVSVDSLVEVLEDINSGDHRHRYLSLAITHIQEAENWIDRWIGENTDLDTGDDDEGLPT